MYNSAINNKVVYALYSTINVRALPSITSALVKAFPAKQAVGRTSGGMFKMKDGDWYQVVFAEKINGKEYGYVKANSVKLEKGSNNVSTEQAQTLVNNLLANDKKIFTSLARSAQKIAELKKSGVNTKTYETKLTELTTRHTERQNKVKESKLLKWQESTDQALKNAASWLSNYAPTRSGGFYGLGAVPIVALVVAAVVGAGLATAAYFAFKPDYDESTTDLNISSDLEQALSKVTPAQATAIKKDLETQIDNAYNQGKTDQSFSSVWPIVKYVAIFGAGYFLIKKFVTTQSKSK